MSPELVTELPRHLLSIADLNHDQALLILDTAE